LGTHHGDSGALWVIDDPDNSSMPLAMQWGGQVFDDAEKKGSSYALATLLSTVCSQLDVSIVRDWNIDLPDYWGAVGHYSIATKACDSLPQGKLGRLFAANVDRISFQADSIEKKTMAGLSKRDFVPLADVPDMVWKVGPYKRGGMTSPEHDNHFADMDRRLKTPIPEGATLLEICDGKPANVAVDVWRRYYDAVQDQFPQEKESRGLLPFRVWQIYDAMVASLKAGKLSEFVCAAGILSHYVGDACQPLHISYLFNGDPDHTVPGLVRDRKTGEKAKGQVPRGIGVHSAYEDDMVNYHAVQILSGVDAAIKRRGRLNSIRGGHAAAVSVVELMQATFATIKPSEIIDTFVDVQDQKPKDRAEALWKVLGTRTVHVMADGCLCLASLWASAWAEGNGNRLKPSGAIDQRTLMSLYQSPKFLPSRRLDTIGSLLADPHAATTLASSRKACKFSRQRPRKAAARKQASTRRVKRA
jgi:hypothetical protein